LRWAAFGVVALLLLSPIAEAARMRSLLQEESFTDEVIDAAALLKDVAAPEEEAVSSKESETEADGFSAEIAEPAGGPAAASEASEGVEGEALGPSSSAESGGTGVDAGFWNGFIRSFIVILFIEVGDRTFFIAALMGIKYNRLTVFLGAFSALAFMTVVSTVLGVAAPMLLPRTFTHYAAFVLFAFFGVQLLHKAYHMEHGVSEELEEVEEELEAKESGNSFVSGWKKFVNPVFVQAFTMTALAEWGDRSQIATIAMAAEYNPYAITVGGSLGHGMATMGAVAGGRYMATKISEKTITFLGGSIFLFFAILAFFEDPDVDMTKSIPAWMTNWAGAEDIE